jgi:hypothetical protein
MMIRHIHFYFPHRLPYATYPAPKLDKDNLEQHHWVNAWMPVVGAIQPLRLFIDEAQAHCSSVVSVSFPDLQDKKVSDKMGREAGRLPLVPLMLSL